MFRFVFKPIYIYIYVYICILSFQETGQPETKHTHTWTRLAFTCLQLVKVLTSLLVCHIYIIYVPRWGRVTMEKLPNTSGAKQTFCYGNAGKKKHLPLSIQYHPIQFHFSQDRRVVFWCFFFCGVVLLCKLTFSPSFNICWSFCITTLHFAVRFCVPTGKIEHPTSVGRFYIETSSLRISCSSSRCVVWLDHWGHVFFGGLLSLKIFGVVLPFACEMRIEFFEVKLMVHTYLKSLVYMMKQCIQI